MRRFFYWSILQEFLWDKARFLTFLFLVYLISGGDKILTKFNSTRLEYAWNFTCGRTTPPRKRNTHVLVIMKLKLVVSTNFTKRVARYCLRGCPRDLFLTSLIICLEYLFCARKKCTKRLTFYGRRLLYLAKESGGNCNMYKKYKNSEPEKTGCSIH